MGGRFCSLHQTSLEIMQFRPRNWMQTKKKRKKRSSPKIEVCFSRNYSEDQKKKSLYRSLGLHSATICWISHCGWLFFVWSSSAQILMDGRLKFQWWDANSRWGARLPASHLQFKYCLKLRSVTYKLAAVAFVSEMLTNGMLLFVTRDFLFCFSKKAKNLSNISEIF